MIEIKTIQLNLTCSEQELRELLDAAGCASITIPDSYYGSYAEVYASDKIAETVLSRLIKERNARKIDGSISILPTT